MTTETYYEMCDQLGSTPEPENIPVSYAELSIQTQVALQVFDYCSDNWDTMNGSYLGKDLNNIEFIFKVLDVQESDWSIVLLILMNIISIRVETVNKKIKSKAKARSKNAN